METKILGISGKTGAGKTTVCNMIHAIALMTTIRDKEGNLLTDKAWVNEQGKLMVGVSPEEYIHLDLDSRNPEVVSRLAENVWPVLKKFSCATPLKEFCVDILGLNPDHVYGTQEDKKNLTHLKWEDMPVPVFQLENGEVKVGGLVDKQFEDSACWDEWVDGVILPEEVMHKDHKHLYGMPKTGFMTVREVLEYFGTQIVRKMYPPAWAKGLVNHINKWSPVGAVIDDVRFLTEVEALKDVGGKVIRLTRSDEDGKVNKHQSNVELDNYDGFDKIIDNANMSLDDLFNEVVKLLLEIGWLSDNE